MASRGSDFYRDGFYVSWCGWGCTWRNGLGTCSEARCGQENDGFLKHNIPWLGSGYHFRRRSNETSGSQYAAITSGPSGGRSPFP